MAFAGVRMFGCGGGGCCDQDEECPLVHEDDFTGTVIDTAWDEVSGTWSQNNTITTTDTEALLITDDSVGSASGIVAVTLGSGTRHAHRVVGAYTDEDNHIFVEVSNDTGAATWDIELYDRSGGVDTLLEEVHMAVAASGTISVILCWNGDNALAEVSSQFTRQLTGDTTQSGQRGGLGTGATATSIQFDDFSFDGNAATVETCSPCRICREACGDGIPATLEVTLPSAWSDPGFPILCESCDEAFNGQTFVLDSLVNIGAAPSGNFHSNHGVPSCVYLKDIGSIGANCQNWSLWAWFTKSRTSNIDTHDLTVVLQNDSDSDQWFRYKVSGVSDKATCSGDSWTLTYDGKGAGTGATCSFNEGSPGTVLVEA